MKYKITLILILVFVIAGFSEENVFFRAMENEIQRGIENLKIENLQEPCFVSAMVAEGDFLVIRSSLGSTLTITERPVRHLRSRVMVGSYERNNENFMDMRGTSGIADETLPVKNSYFGIRRAIWLAMDRSFKNSAELYESKMSAIRQQNIPEELENLADFSKAEKTKLILPAVKFEYDRGQWEKTANELSSIFLKYPDIHSSGVSIYFYNTHVYFYNSEGTRTAVPFNMTAVYVDANTQADDGEPVFDFLTYYGIDPNDLPEVDKMKKDIELMAKRTVNLRKAPVFDDVYMGPVLFEGCSVGELISQSLFPVNAGMSAVRKPIFSDSRIASFYGSVIGSNFEDMIGRRFMSRDFNLMALPKLKEYNGINLIGHFQVDAEGIIPEDELILIEEGMLKGLLSDRTPTPRIQKSNGHSRLSMDARRINTQVGPGIIKLEPIEEGKDRKALKELLIQTAKEEGLDYAIIIRKVISPSATANSPIDEGALASMFSQGRPTVDSGIKPVYVYKVYVEDGREELVRSVDLQTISSRAFRDIIGWSSKMTAYNTISISPGAAITASIMARGGWNIQGIPSSFIVPDALLFENLELKRERRAVTSRPPAIESPLVK